jgi:uncharacterized lipoprotein YmbA
VLWEKSARAAGNMALLPAAICLAMLCSCSSPNPTLYTISMVPGQVMPGGPAVISIRDIAIARYLERPQIVRSENDNQLDVRANEWWGEPLGAMLSRVLAEELAQRLPQSTVLGENGAINSAANATVEINIERLDASAPQTIQLIAHTYVSFANSRARPVLNTVRVQAEGQTPTMAGLVAAMSTAIGQLADSLAGTLRAHGTGS